MGRSTRRRDRPRSDHASSSPASTLPYRRNLSIVPASARMVKRGSWRGSEQGTPYPWTSAVLTASNERGILYLCPHYALPHRTL